MEHRKYFENDIYVDRVLREMAESGEFPYTKEQLRFIVANTLRFIEMQYKQLQEKVYSLEEGTAEDIVLQKLQEAMEEFGEVEIPNFGKFHINETAFNNMLKFNFNIPAIFNVYVSGSSYARMKRKMYNNNPDKLYNGKTVIPIGGKATKAYDAKAYDKVRNAGTKRKKFDKMKDVEIEYFETKSTLPLLNGSKAAVLDKKK